MVPEPTEAMVETGLDRLKGRYARGDIDLEEFESLVEKELESPSYVSRPITDEPGAVYEAQGNPASLVNVNSLAKQL